MALQQILEPRAAALTQHFPALREPASGALQGTTMERQLRPAVEGLDLAMSGLLQAVSASCGRAVKTDQAMAAGLPGSASQRFLGRLMLPDPTPPPPLQAHLCPMSGAWFLIPPPPSQACPCPRAGA